MIGILAEAHELAHNSRQLSYGDPCDNHTRTAQMWSAFLGIDITARQVCLMNILQKISRDAHRVKRDNLVDIAGYADNADRCS